MHQFLLFALSLAMLACIAVIGPPRPVDLPTVEATALGGAPAALTLTLGVVATGSAAEEYRRYAPLLEELNVALSAGLERQVDVELSLAGSQAAAVRDFLRGEVDFTRLDPAAYVLAKDRLITLRPLAVEQPLDEALAGCSIVVRSDSELETLEQLAGRRLAFGDPHSRAGRSFAQALLVERDLRANDFAAYAYLDRDARVALAVLNGEFEAGALGSGGLSSERRAGLRQVAALPAPGEVWVGRANLERELDGLLQDILLGLGGEPLRAATGAAALRAAEDAEFAGTRAAMELALRFERRRE